MVPMLVGATACGGGDDADSAAAVSGGSSPADATTASVDPASRPCSEERHMVVFDFFGSLNGGVPELATWIGDPDDGPTPRAGAAEVATAYRRHGYEVLYLTLVPTDTMIGDVPITVAVTAWLALHGFPAGTGTQVWAWDGQGSAPVVRAIDELVRLSTEGVSVDAGYTDNVDKANALLTGGVPTDRLFTLGAAASEVSSSSIPGGDLAAHVATVEALERVCQPG